MCVIKTARIGYKGKPGETVLDTTIKSASTLVEKAFAPTWEMVMGFKNGHITWEQYAEQYYALMRHRYSLNPAIFHEVVKRDTIVLMCYCNKANRQCHRYLLQEILQKLAIHQNITVTLEPEDRS